jgi:hypothetical protein
MNEFEAWANQMADQISGREYASESEIFNALKQAFLYGSAGDQTVADIMAQMMSDLSKLQSQVHEHGSRIEMIGRGIDSTAAAVTFNHTTMLGHATQMTARVGALEEKLNQAAKVSAHEILDNLEKMRVWALGETASETGGPAEGSAELISEQSARHATDTATPEWMAAVQAAIAPYDVDQDGRVVLQNVSIEQASISDLQVERSARAVNEDDILAEPATAVTAIDAQVGDTTLAVTSGLPLSAHLGLCLVDSEMALSVNGIAKRPVIVKTITLTPEMMAAALNELVGFAYSNRDDISESDVLVVERAIRACLSLAPEGAVEVVSESRLHQPGAVRLP